MIQQPTKMKITLALVVMVAVMVTGAVPALSREVAEETAVTGVVGAEGKKADGTPIYGIKDETTLGEDWYQREGYLMEGDFSAYVGKRVTVRGTLEPGYAERVLDVSSIEEVRQDSSNEGFEFEDGDGSPTEPGYV